MILGLDRYLFGLEDGIRKQTVCGVGVGGGGEGSSPPLTLTAERHPFPMAPRSSPVTKKNRLSNNHQSSSSQLRQCQLKTNPPYRYKIEIPAPEPREASTTGPLVTSIALDVSRRILASINPIDHRGRPVRPISNTTEPPLAPSRAPLPKGEHRQRGRGGKHAQRPRAPETRFELHPLYPTSQVSQANPLFMLRSAECRTSSAYRSWVASCINVSRACCNSMNSACGVGGGKKLSLASKVASSWVASGLNSHIGMWPSGTRNRNAGCASSPPPSPAGVVKVHIQVRMK